MAKTRKTILIVEDEPSVIKVLSEKLEKKYEIYAAKDGIAGLKEAKKINPDLILLDIIMPKMDGITMLKKMRETEWGRKIRVIILTNLSGETELMQAMEAGVYDYLVKADWTLKDIVEKIKERLK